MAYSFGTQGSTPMATSSLTGLSVPGSITGSSPAAKALNGATPGTMSSNANVVTSALGSAGVPKNTSTPYNANIAPVTAGLIPKSQTINNVDGSSHTVTYQPPATQTDASAPISSSTSGTVQESPTDAAFGIGSYATQPSTQQASTGSSGASTGTTAGLLAPQAGAQPTSVGTNPTPASVGGILGNLSLNGTPQVDAANKALTDYQSQVSNALGAVGSTAGPLGNQLGLESNINSAAALKEQALETGVSNALAQQGQQITGLNDTGTLVNPANQFTQVSPGNIAYNGQGQAIASTPTNQPIGQTTQVSPTPNLSGGTAGESSSYTIKSGDTLNAIAAANGISESALQAANPNAVATNLQPGQTLNIPSSASTSGTPFQAGVVAGQQANGTQYAQNYSAYQQAESIRSNINSIIASNPNLNPSVFTSANQALQFLNGQVSNPAYAILANNVAEYVNTLAPILGVGGDTTNYKTALAQQFLQGAASGQSMSQIMDGIAQTAALKLNTQATAGGSTGAVSAPASSGSSGGVPMFGSFN